MRLHRPALIAGAGMVTLAMALTGCGEAGSSGTTAPNTSPEVEAEGGVSCEPVAGEELVVLEDDQSLQTVDNIIPAVTEQAATEPLLEALNRANAALTTDELIELNRSVVVDRETSASVAQQFVESEGLTEGLSGGSGAITVGSANFAESQTLAEIYALVLDAAGFDASTQTIGNRELYIQALRSGEIQVVPEYAGTLTEFLNASVNGANPEPLASSDLEETVANLEELAAQVGLVVGQPSEAADQNAFAVTQAFAEEYGVSTLSELSETCGNELLLGGPPECPGRPFCLPGLEETYGLDLAFQSLDAGGPLTKQALRQGEIALGLVFSSDGELATTS